VILSKLLHDVPPPASTRYLVNVDYECELSPLSGNRSCKPHAAPRLPQLVEDGMFSFDGGRDSACSEVAEIGGAAYSRRTYALTSTLSNLPECATQILSSQARSNKHGTALLCTCENMPNSFSGQKMKRTFEYVNERSPECRQSRSCVASKLSWMMFI
jgi:hypothetical protein